VRPVADAPGPRPQHLVLAWERHLHGKLVRAEPGELVDVVGGHGLALYRHDPGEPEDEGRVVEIDERADSLDGLDLEARLFQELAA